MAEQPRRGMELQGKDAQKDYNIQEICLILDLKPFRSCVKGKHFLGTEFQGLAV